MSYFILNKNESLFEYLFVRLANFIEANSPKIENRTKIVNTY